MAPTIEIVGYIIPRVREWHLGTTIPRRMGQSVARVQVHGDPLVVEKHCVVTQDQDGVFWVTDPGRKDTPNGTWLTPNGIERMDGTMLAIRHPLVWHPGYTLWIGRTPIPRPGEVTANAADPYNLGTAWAL